MSHIRKYRVNSGDITSSTEFYPVLKKYLELNKFFLDELKGEDCPWLYGERANTGIFAASVWEVGEIALEEYSADKSRKGVNRTQKYLGRNDLYFKIGRKQYVAEAKHFALPYPRKNYVQLMEAKFEAALNDARSIKNPKYTRLGILFVIPRIRYSRIEYLQEYISEIKKAVSDLSYDAIAWTFPKPPSPIIHPGNKDLYPGIIMVIKKVFNRNHAT